MTKQSMYSPFGKMWYLAGKDAFEEEYELESKVFDLLKIRVVEDFYFSCVEQQCDNLKSGDLDVYEPRQWLDVKYKDHKRVDKEIMKEVVSTWLIRVFLMVFFATNFVSSSSLASRIVVNKEEIVKLELYYEALCPDCEDFVVNYLYKIFENGLISIVDLKLSPYGNAKISSDGSIVCQQELCLSFLGLYIPNGERRKCFRCGDPNHLDRECPKPPKDKNQRAFIEGSWSDSVEEADEKAKDETYLVAQALNELCSDSSYFSDENSLIDDFTLDNEYDKL
nr:thioredoxin superfamily protein [Tanacetum cinerariifolium]